MSWVSVPGSRQRACSPFSYLNLCTLFVKTTKSHAISLYFISEAPCSHNTLCCVHIFDVGSWQFHIHMVNFTRFSTHLNIQAVPSMCLATLGFQPCQLSHLSFMFIGFQMCLMTLFTIFSNSLSIKNITSSLLLLDIVY